MLVTEQVDMALGGDQGGSIRIPAAWSGVVGHKPTYGLVPYTGCMMIEMTLDHCGPMANTVEDVALMLSAIAGPDPLDPRQRGVIPADYVRDYSPAIGKEVAGMRIGLVKEGFGQEPWEDLGLGGSEEVVDAKVRAAARRLEEQGATVEEVSIPMHVDGAYIFTAIIREGAHEFMAKGNNGRHELAGVLQHEPPGCGRARRGGAAQRPPPDGEDGDADGRVPQALLPRPLLRQGAESPSGAGQGLRRRARGA